MLRNAIVIPVWNLVVTAIVGAIRVEFLLSTKYTKRPDTFYFMPLVGVSMNTGRPRISLCSFTILLGDFYCRIDHSFYRDIKIW